MFYTYAHYKPNGELFYIGKGSGARINKKDGRNLYWKRTVLKYGSFTYKVLAYWETEQEAFEHERFLICCFKDMGVELSNLTNGGEGASGYKKTKQQKLNLSIAKKGKKRPPFSNTWIENLSKSTIGGNNPRAIRIKFNGQVFSCIKELALYINVSVPTVYSRVQNNPKKWGYEVLQK